MLVLGLAVGELAELSGNEVVQLLFGFTEAIDETLHPPRLRIGGTPLVARHLRIELSEVLGNYYAALDE